MYHETLENLMESEGLTSDSVMYRYTNKHHIGTDEEGKNFINANPNSEEIVIDHYGQGHSMAASEFGPGLAFALSKESRFKNSDRLCVSVKLEDILNQGGQIYQDQSSGEPGSWYLTMPNGSVKITTV